MKFNPCYAALDIIEGRAEEVCPAPWLFLMIYPNGEHSPCCWMLKKGKGADKIENLDSLWNSQYYQRLRYHISRKEYDLAECNPNCVYLNKNLKGPFDPGYFLENIPETALEQDNFIRTLEEYKQRKQELDTSPPMVQTILSYKCDIKCFMCTQDHSLPTRIPESTIRILAQHVGEFSTWIFLGGEIFADPESIRLMEIVLEQKKPELCVVIVTNGLQLNTKRLSSLLEYELPRIVFSVASVDKEIYSFIQGHDRQDRVLENLEDAVKMFRERGAIKNICLRQVLMKSNLKSVPKTFELCKRLGIQLELDTIYGPFPEENIFNYGCPPDVISEVKEVKQWIERRRTDAIFPKYSVRRILACLEMAINYNRNSL